MIVRRTLISPDKIAIVQKLEKQDFARWLAFGESRLDKINEKLKIYVFAF